MRHEREPVALQARIAPGAEIAARQDADYVFYELTLEALGVAACRDEVYRFFGWMAGAVAAQLQEGADLQIMFGVGGEHDLSERTLDHLTGWRGSRPVRVGNGAWNQRQLDIYGELLG